MLSFCRQIAAIVLLVVMFLLPLASVAQSFEVEGMGGGCVCHQLHDGWDHDSNEDHGEMPSGSTSDCCDHENCGHDSAEPPSMQTTLAGVSILNQFWPYSVQIPPEVYLSIFVPPES